jgi:hypothetical protein
VTNTHGVSRRIDGLFSFMERRDYLIKIQRFAQEYLPHGILVGAQLGDAMWRRSQS